MFYKKKTVTIRCQTAQADVGEIKTLSSRANMHAVNSEAEIFNCVWNFSSWGSDSFFSHLQLNSSAASRCVQASTLRDGNIGDLSALTFPFPHPVHHKQLWVCLGSVVRSLGFFFAPTAKGFFDSQDIFKYFHRNICNTCILQPTTNVLISSYILKTNEPISVPFGPLCK